MQPASRTPEGEPNRCPICGAEIVIAPSRPSGEGPCPQCANLLWFDRRSGGAGMPVNESPSNEDRINEAIAAYIEAVERGESPDTEKFLAEALSRLPEAPRE